MFTLRAARHGDELALEDFFRDFKDNPYFQPHPWDYGQASKICVDKGEDVYLVLVSRDDVMAYGMLRGWTEGWKIPSLGIAVRMAFRRRGFARLMLEALHVCARTRQAPAIRLRVHPDNMSAKRLYTSMGYEYQEMERGEELYLLHLR